MLLAVSLPSCSQNGNANSTSNMELTIAAAVVSQVAGLPSSTPVPTLTPEPPTATATVPSPTASKTTQVSPTQATSTVYPYITWTPSQCDKSAFMADLDIVDYSFVYPGTNFTKTWRIKNIGTCTWTTKYRFQYISGNPMGADTIYLPRSVAPGDTIDISLNMRAPDIDEDYSNFWRLRNAAGEIFGTTFYVAIEVSKSRVSVTPSPTTKPASATPTLTSVPSATATLVATTEIPTETVVETLVE
jgi:hypothetical protein